MDITEKQKQLVYTKTEELKVSSQPYYVAVNGNCNINMVAAVIRGTDYSDRS